MGVCFFLPGFQFHPAMREDKMACKEPASVLECLPSVSEKLIIVCLFLFSLWFRAMQSLWSGIPAGSPPCPSSSNQCRSIKTAHGRVVLVSGE